MRAVTLAFYGHRQTSPATPLVVEYLERKRLAKLGITTSTSEISAFKSDTLLLIDAEFDRLREADSKRKAKKR